MKIRSVPRICSQLRFLAEAILLICACVVLLSRTSPPTSYHTNIDYKDAPVNSDYYGNSDNISHRVSGLQPYQDVMKANTMEDDSLMIPPDNVPPDSYWSDQNQLLEGMIAPNVYYYWCGKRAFEFKHYLSVVSVIRAMRPDKIIFHYEFQPVVERNQYNTWFDELKRDIQFFEPRPMTGPILKAMCTGNRVEKMGVILGKLTQNGGLYVSVNTWIMDLSPKDRQMDLDLSVGADDIEGYILMKPGLMQAGITVGDLKRNASLRVHRGSCGAMRHLYTGGAGKCVIVKGGQYEKIFPIKVKDLDDPFGRLVRKLFYGSEAIPKAVPTYDVLVPNIGHMIWIGGGRMSYVFYLSVLSLLYVVKVDVVYIHGDLPPKGEYWKEICDMPRVRDRIKLISRTSPTSVYQGYIEPYYRALMSDIIRVDLMLKYGGVYTDTDAIWVKPLTHEERGYEAVATYDWVDWTKPFPDVVNFGVSYGKRNAPFWRIFRESMRVLHNDLHGHTGVAKPYKLYERHPELLRIDMRLGVICYYGKCHPLWVENYHNGSNNHLTTNSIKNWREDVHAFHWTFPDPDELQNRTGLMQSTGLFAEIGKFVLEKAGLL